MKTAHPSVPATTLLKFTSSLLLLWFLSFAMYVDAQSLNWRQIPGAALDIAVGANGTVWAIGYDAGKTDHSIYLLFLFPVFPVSVHPLSCLSVLKLLLFFARLLVLLSTGNLLSGN